MKYIKKPVIVEAHQWFKNGDHPLDDCPIVKHNVRYLRLPDIGKRKCKHCGIPMHNHGWIDTIQGGHVVCPGDWIITDDRVKKGKHGHYDHCKPDVFEATYEEVK